MPGLRTQTATVQFSAPVDTTELAADWIINRTFQVPKFNAPNVLLVDADIQFSSRLSADVVAFDNPFFPTGQAEATLRQITEFSTSENGPDFDVANVFHIYSGINSTVGGSTLLPFRGTVDSPPRMMGNLDAATGPGRFSVDAALLGGATGSTGPATVSESASLTLTIRVSYDYIRQSDIIFGNASGNQITGSGSRDMIKARDGNDIVNAGNGADIVSGGNGRDTLVGQQGDDDLRGERGKDLLAGGNGQDQLLGGRGFDTLRGGDGMDLLQGDEGFDILYGGRGADHFIFSDDGQGDLVKDYQVGLDVIDLSNFDELNDVAELDFVQNGSKAKIKYQGDLVASFENTDVEDLAQDVSNYIL